MQPDVSIALETASHNADRRTTRHVAAAALSVELLEAVDMTTGGDI
jgi:hypothetical protein